MVRRRQVQAPPFSLDSSSYSLSVFFWSLRACLRASSISGAHSCSCFSARLMFFSALVCIFVNSFRLLFVAASLTARIPSLYSIQLFCGLYQFLSSCSLAILFGLSFGHASLWYFLIWFSSFFSSRSVSFLNRGLFIIFIFIFSSPFPDSGDDASRIVAVTPL